MARHDYMHDEDGDLLIKNGDFVRGESTFQHARLITIMAPGDLRQFPWIGFLAIRYQNAQASRKQQFISELRAAYEADGIKVNSIDVSMPEWWKHFVVDIE